jgi:hypothetical protein
MPPVTQVILHVTRPGHRRGRWHTAARTAAGQRLTPEACNLDQAHTVEEHQYLPPTAPTEDLCRRCFADMLSNL